MNGREREALIQRNQELPPGLVASARPIPGEQRWGLIFS